MPRIALWSALVVLLAGCGSAVSLEDPDDTGSEQLGLCTPPDPTVTFDMTVEATAWLSEPTDDPLGEQPTTIEMSTSCVVGALEGATDALTIRLDCVGDDFEDAPVVVRLKELPESWAIDLAEEEQLQVDYSWHSSGHHQIEGAWLTMVRPGGALVLAATKNGSVKWMDGHINHLAIEVDDGICPSPCEDANSSFCEEPWRLGLSIESQGGSLTVLDGGRGTVPSMGRDYDVTVATAERYTCLNCPTLFSVVIAARP